MSDREAVTLLVGIQVKSIRISTVPEAKELVSRQQNHPAPNRELPDDDLRQSRYILGNRRQTAAPPLDDDDDDDFPRRCY